MGIEEKLILEFFTKINVNLFTGSALIIYIEIERGFVTVENKGDDIDMIFNGYSYDILTEFNLG